MIFGHSVVHTVTVQQTDQSSHNSQDKTLAMNMDYNCLYPLRSDCYQTMISCVWFWAEMQSRPQTGHLRPRTWLRGHLQMFWLDWWENTTMY